MEEQNLQSVLGGMPNERGIIDQNHSSTEVPDVDMILAHFSKGELQALDNMQGGPSIDDDTGYREYSKLANIAEEPAIRKIFEYVKNTVGKDDPMENRLKQIVKVGKKSFLPFKKAPQDDLSPDLGEHGRGEDKLMAKIPTNLAKYLIELNDGQYSLNPTDGLLEFFLGEALEMVSGLLNWGSEKFEANQNASAAQRSNELTEQQKEEIGWNLKLAPRPGKSQRVKNPKYTLENDELYYLPGTVPVGQKKGTFKKGGLVKKANHKELGSFTKSTGIYGPGNGQDDKIRTKIPSGTYIIDASSTADLGDGSSSSGIKVLKEAVDHIRKNKPSHVIKKVEKFIKKDSKPTDVYLANEEFKIDPVTVALAGGGSVDKGAKIFDKMVKEIRSHKNSNGLELPPKSRHPLQYMKMV